MGDYRSKSFSNGGGAMEMESYYIPTTTRHDYAYNEYRSYSASYASSSSAPPPPSYAAPPPPPPPTKLREKGKGSSSSKAWSFIDPELQRKKRVASYKAYSVEGKVKGSLRKSFRWVKDKCSQIVYGW